MKANRLIRIALRSLTKNKMRASLTMLGVIIGVAAVIVMPKRLWEIQQLCQARSRRGIEGGSSGSVRLPPARLR